MNDQSLLNPAARSAQVLKNCQTWAEVERVIRLCPQHEAEAWRLLTEEERAQIKGLKHTLELLLPIKVGDRVFVTAGIYRTEGGGVVECVRGAGTLQMLEVRMPDKKIQVISTVDVRRQEP